MSVHIMRGDGAMVPLKDYAAEDWIKLHRVSTESIRKALQFKSDVRVLGLWSFGRRMSFC